MALDITRSQPPAIGMEHHGNHPPDGGEWFQESALFNFSDPRSGIGGQYRIGIHPVHQSAHLYTWTQINGKMVDKRFIEGLKLPEGDVNDCALSDVTFATLEPYKKYRIQVVQPEFELDVIWEAFTIPIQMGFNVGGATVAAGHYNCIGRATGKAMYKGVEFSINGDGFMDHSWGARKTHVPGSRWILAIVDPECFFMALPLLTDVGRFMAGYVAFDGKLRMLTNDFDINMTMRDDWFTPAACDARFFDEDGRGFRLSGRSLGPSSSQPFLGGKAYTHALAEFEFGGRIGRGLLESSAPENLLPSMNKAYQLDPAGIWCARQGL